jgi:SAM-dependent methyltransferase
MTDDRQPRLPGDAYARAGVHDVGAFYRTKFASDEILDARYFHPLSRFDIRFARTMWVYDNVRAGSSLLDLGCGAGLLALLKRKDVFLAGVDLSDACAADARRNGYDQALQATLDALPFADATFDYVTSLDVLGHVPMEDKDRVLDEIRRVLKPGGVTLHGVECFDAEGRGYEGMDGETLRRFVEVDGHVGLEDEAGHARRFARVFPHVAWRSRFTLCLSSEEFLKQADSYGARYEPDWLEYLRSLSFRERRAFDLAMGYVFATISDMDLRLPNSGFYVLMKASDAPLGPFYNEHRDHRRLLADVGGASAIDSRCLDRSPDVVFDHGWYDAEDLPPIARWMRESAHIRFVAPSLSRIRLDAVTHMPDLPGKPLSVSLVLNGVPIELLSVARTGWRHVEVIVPEPLRRPVGGRFDLELRANRTWQPRPDGAERDDRDLSIAVCNIEAVL